MKKRIFLTPLAFLGLLCLLVMTPTIWASNGNLTVTISYGDPVAVLPINDTGLETANASPTDSAKMAATWTLNDSKALSIDNGGSGLKIPSYNANLTAKNGYDKKNTADSDDQAMMNANANPAAYVAGKVVNGLNSIGEENFDGKYCAVNTANSVFNGGSALKMPLTTSLENCSAEFVDVAYLKTGGSGAKIPKAAPSNHEGIFGFTSIAS